MDRPPPYLRLVESDGAPKLWRDRAGNWYTGDYGTHPISYEEAVALMTPAVPPPLTLRGALVIVAVCIALFVLIIGGALWVTP